MNLIERVKRILTTPKTEWITIETETTTPQALLTSYVVPLAAVGALGWVLSGLLYTGAYDMQFWIIRAVISFLSSVIGYYVSAYIIDALAPSFNSQKNINSSAQLVAYAYTPAWIAAFLVFIPYLGPLISIAGFIYMIYLMYLGLGPIKKTPEDKKVVYLIVSFLIIFVVALVITAILNAIIMRSMGYSGYSSYGY